MKNQQSWRVNPRPTSLLNTKRTGHTQVTPQILALSAVKYRLWTQAGVR